MKCPACGYRATRSRRTGQLYCARCGWGTDDFRPEVAKKKRRTARARRVDVTFLTVLALWVMSGAIVYAFYWFVFSAVRVERSAQNILLFAVALGVYALAGWVFRPEVDPEKLGMAGNMLIDNPFTLSDDIERFKLVFLIVCYPGRIMAGAVVGLFRLVGQSFGRKEPPPRPNR